MAPTISDNLGARAVAFADQAVPEFRSPVGRAYSCTGHKAKEWTAAYLAAKAALEAAPAPLPFPARQDSLGHPPEVLDAWDGLMGDLEEARATLDALEAAADLMRRGRVSVAGLRSAAETLDNLGDVAREAARAIWDAIPDQVGTGP